MDFKQWMFQLWDVNKNEPIDDDTGMVGVYESTTPNEVSLTDRFGTALANPVTFSNGKVTFYTAKSVTAVTLSGITANGEAFFMPAVSASIHRVNIDTFKRDHVLVVPFINSDNAETDTGLDLPANLLVHEVLMRVTTVDPTETIDFGILSSETGGDANGFVVAASVATAGIVQLVPQITGGINIDFVSTNYVGALLATSIVGADAVATVGGWTPLKYRTDGVAKSLTYTGTAGSDTAEGYFYLRYSKLA